MSQPNTLEQFCQWLDATDAWNFESEVLKTGGPKESEAGPSTKGKESAPTGGDDDGDGNEKRCNRYTERQIQGLQALFDKYRTPDPEQREELGRRLGLTPVQVKYWCDKKRRKLNGERKERETMSLRAEVQRLRAENKRYRNVLGTLCFRCGGETTAQEQCLIDENDRLKDDMDTIFAIVLKHDKEHSTSTHLHLPSSSRSLQPQAQSGPMRSTPIPLDGRSTYHPEWSYLDDELAIMTSQVNAKKPKL